MSSIPEPSISPQRQVSPLSSSLSPQEELTSIISGLRSLKIKTMPPQDPNQQPKPGNDLSHVTEKYLLSLDERIAQLEQMQGINHNDANKAKTLLLEVCENLIECNLIEKDLSSYEANTPQREYKRQELLKVYLDYPPPSRLNPGHVELGLKQIASKFTETKIPGDGNCCFRSIACVLAEKIADRDGALFVEKICKQAQTAIENMRDVNDKNLAREALKPLEAAMSALATKKDKSPKDISTFVNDNAVVASLRTLSTVCNVDTLDATQATKDALKASAISWYEQQHKNDIDYEEGQASEATQLLEYLNDMRDMQKKEYGTNFEIEALAHLFGVGITAVDAKAIGSAAANNPRVDVDRLISNYRLGIQPQDKSHGEFYILQRPGHFDALSKTA
jgi:hypothetical protein